jgi:Flp pilus assembly protein TadG
VRFTRAAPAQMMVEMAVVFPLLVVVMIGLVQFAIFAHAQNVVQAAAQEGARTAAARGASCMAGENRARDLLRAGLNPNLDITVNVCPAGEDPDLETVRAEVAVALPSFIPWVNSGEGATNVTLPLRAVAVMSKERFRGGPEPRR